jgi:hypothetical protein
MTWVDGLTAETLAIFTSGGIMAREAAVSDSVDILAYALNSNPLLEVHECFLSFTRSGNHSKIPAQIQLKKTSVEILPKKFLRKQGLNLYWTARNWALQRLQSAHLLLKRPIARRPLPVLRNNEARRALHTPTPATARAARVAPAMRVLPLALAAALFFGVTAIAIYLSGLSSCNVPLCSRGSSFFRILVACGVRDSDAGWMCVQMAARGFRRRI